MRFLERSEVAARAKAAFASLTPEDVAIALQKWMLRLQRPRAVVPEARRVAAKAARRDLYRQAVQFGCFQSKSRGI